MLIACAGQVSQINLNKETCHFVCCVISVCYCVANSKMSSSISRRDIISLLSNKNPPIKPSKSGYKEQIESAILHHFGLAKENLKDSKKFSAYCSQFAFKAFEIYSKESKNKIDVLLDTQKHLTWIDSPIDKPDAIEVRVPKRSYPGAPKKAFCDKGPTGQNIEANDVKNYASCSTALFKAAKLSADEDGLKDVSFVLKEVAKDTATATEMRAAFTASKKGISSSLSTVFFVSYACFFPIFRYHSVYRC